MRFDWPVLYDSFWAELVHAFHNPPHDVLDAVELLTASRSALRNALHYLRSCHVQLDLVMHAHDETIAAIEQTLLQLSQGKTPTGPELYALFQQQHRELAVRAAEQIAAVLRSLSTGTRFCELPESERFELILRVVGHTPLGAEMARSARFRDRLAELFENSLVRERAAIDGPMAGAMQWLALYLDVSVATVRRRLREYRQRRGVGGASSDRTVAHRGE